MTEKGKHLGIHALKIRKPIVDRDLGNDQSEPPREVLVFISEQSETRAAAHHFLPYAVKFYAYFFCRQRFGRCHRSATGRAVRLPGEFGLRFGVRLSDDCYRSVAVWAKGPVKAQPQACDLEKRRSSLYRLSNLSELQDVIRSALKPGPEIYRIKFHGPPLPWR
jgi:hypothetical protein